MTVELEDRLRVAVDALSLPRLIPTTLKDDDGNWVGISTVEHPALLVQLVEGTGISRKPGSSSAIRLPIDAEALEILAQITDRLRVWCVGVRSRFGRHDVPKTLLVWSRVFQNHVAEGHVSEDDELDTVRTVESWVRMIERKFDPDKIIEWTDACYECGARRVVVDDTERFAIKVNLTQHSAECAACSKTWTGDKELMQLRYFTNLVAEGNEI